MFRFLILSTIFFLSLTCLSQDQILTMSGRLIDCKIIDDKEIELRFEVTKKNGKTKERTLHKSEIFSVQKGMEEPVIYYEKNADFGDWMTQEEMRVYIQGEMDARENYDVRWIKYAGYIAGSGIGYALQGAMIAGFIFPILYTAYQFVPFIKIKGKFMSDTGYKYNDFYLNGFEPVARTKRVMAALKSSLIGSAVGAIVYILIPIK